MHYSSKSLRIYDKVKNHNSQMPPPYNPGTHFLSTPNVSNSGQLQINRKYINNMGNINDVSILQYHRTTNMQIKNNNLEMNHYQNLRHQHQQAFVYKAPQYRPNNINLNMLPVNHPMQRKMVKEQAIPAGMQQPHTNAEFSSKKFKELKNQEEVNKLNNQYKVLLTKHKKFPTKATYSKEESKEGKVGNVQLIKNRQVPENAHVAHENMTGNKENNGTEAQNMEEISTINNEQTEDQCDEASDKLTKSAREKTPMCLINDLARFNKISFQYRLTSENGPAHCKRFTVTLMLGDEEYTADGLKIKQAQHLAAKEAIEKTKYKHPTPKILRRSNDNNVAKSNVTPTVELNALAMKLGQQTYYIFDSQQIESNSNYRLINNTFESNSALPQQKQSGIMENLIQNCKQVPIIHQRRQYLSKSQNRYTPFQHSQPNNSAPAAYAYFPATSPCKITLIVGTKEFVGVGRTIQQAKHDAASNALKVLKEQMATEQLQTQCESMEDNDSKSPISLVFEIGIRRSLSVDFKVLREEGPAHMRTFVTACLVGDIVTEGEGTGKKISKKKAAQKMLEELKKLPLTPLTSPVKRTKLKTSSKKNCVEQSENANLDESKRELERPWHKNKKTTTDSEATNPINILLEWHQNKKEKEPEFKLISEFGKENSRRRQFVMEVSSNNIVARGVGNSKKLAKQDAAQNFLIAIAENNGEATSENDNNKKNVTKTTSIKVSHGKNIPKQDSGQNFLTSEAESETKSATAEAEKQNTKKASNISELKENVTETDFHSPLKEETGNSLVPNKKSCLENQTIVKATSVSSTASIIDETSRETSKTEKNSMKSQNLHMKDQLMYLAKLLGFVVEFSDYPKGNHDEFLTIVMLSTTPPQICHGVGVNANESQEDAARNALKILSEMGLNNAVKS